MQKIGTHYDEMETSRLIAEEKERLALKAVAYAAMWERYKVAMWRFLIAATAALGIAGSVALFFGNPSFC